jgi:hypothetical protein
VTVAAENVKRYRSKPVEVDAVLVTESNLRGVASWCGGKMRTAAALSVGVPTVNGEAYAYVGHYVVRGPNDFYPCDPDTFASRWEAI